jgi:hypothetical protein
MPAFLDVLEKVREAMPGVVHVVGVEHLSSAKLEPGNVVWVPSGDVYGPPSASRAPTRGVPQARLERAETVLVFSWGIASGAVRTAEADMRAAMALATSVLFAVEDVMGGSYRVASGSWEANAPKAQLGRMYVMTFEFKAPVVRPVVAATVAAVETVTELAPASE